MVQEISVSEALTLPGAVFVDVRSPSEYEQACIPGAFNIPLLSDEERAEIGKVYHQHSPEKAKMLGLEMVSPRLGQLVEKYQERSAGRPVVIYCWRGGLRSHSVAAVLELVGIPVFCLAGGYKAYRKLVTEYLYQLPLKPTVVVLHGLTGVGKTEVLGALDGIGVATVDLEGAACHRGSVFGDIGMGAQPSQKAFESSLFHRLKAMDTEPFLVTECESRKIGRLFVPPSLFEAMNQGGHILLFTDIRHRVDRLLEIYHSGGTRNQAEIIDSIKQLTPRLGHKTANSLVDGVVAGNLELVVETLLTQYYDPLYGYPDKPGGLFDLCVDSSDIGSAAQVIKQYLTGKLGL